MGSFAADITKWVKKTGIKADTVLKKIGFTALEGVLLMSPVRTGRFRGSWRVGINKGDLTMLPVNFNHTLDAGPKEQAKQMAFTNGTNQINKAKFGMTILLTNNVPYGPRLERGWSGQAPHGVVGPTFIRIREGLRNIIKAA